MWQLSYKCIQLPIYTPVSPLVYNFFTLFVIAKSVYNPLQLIVSKLIFSNARACYYSMEGEFQCSATMLHLELSFKLNRNCFKIVLHIELQNLLNYHYCKCFSFEFPCLRYFISQGYSDNHDLRHLPVFSELIYVLCFVY